MDPEGGGVDDLAEEVLAQDPLRDFLFNFLGHPVPGTGQLPQLCISVVDARPGPEIARGDLLSHGGQSFQGTQKPPPAHEEGRSRAEEDDQAQNGQVRDQFAPHRYQQGLVVYPDVDVEVWGFFGSEPQFLKGVKPPDIVRPGSLEAPFVTGLLHLVPDVHGHRVSGLEFLHRRIAEETFPLVVREGEDIAPGQLAFADKGCIAVELQRHHKDRTARRPRESLTGWAN